MRPNFCQVNNLVAEVLILNNFKLPRINTYKKMGGANPKAVPRDRPHSKTEATLEGPSGDLWCGGVESYCLSR